MHPVMRRVIHSVYSVGICRRRKLWISLEMTAFGNAPEMSRKRPETTKPFLHFLKVQWTASISESVVDHPGLPPKWLEGRRSWVSERCTRSSATMDDKIFAIVLRRVMGRYAFGNE